MSDVQCAATVVLLPAGAEADVDELRTARPAAVLCPSGAARAGETLARLLGVGHAELPDDSDDRLLPVLEELADEYRGECVVVLVPPAVLTGLARQVLPAGEADGLVVEIDADGHRWAPWPPAAGVPGPSGIPSLGEDCR